MENKPDTSTRDAAATPATRAGAARMCAETVRVIVQSTQRGEALTPGGAAHLASDAEYRLREIIQDAVKFMKHSKRRRLLPDDINAALRLRNVAQTYGFGRAAPDSAPLVRPASNSAPSPKRQKTDSLGWRAADGIDNVFFTADKPTLFKNILEKPLPPRPLDVTIAPHWLAVSGVQPAIPQNPPPITEPTTVKKEDVVANGTSSVPNGTVVANGHTRDHVLSKELQLYFDTLVEELAGDNAKRIDALLDSVSQEPGLLQLLPYFVRHVTTTVRDAVDKAPKDGGAISTNTLRNLLSSMRLVRAMHSNPHFRMESYLHKLFPVICTCVVGKRLYQKPRENHWALRDFSSRLLRDICTDFREKYSNLQTRLSKTFLSAFTDPKKSLTTHYGAIVGLGTLGKYVVDATVLRLFGPYVTRVTKLLDDPKLKRGSVRRFEIAKVLGAIVFALSVSKDDSVAKHDLFSSDKHGKDAAVGVPGLPASFSETVASLESEFGKRIYPYQKSDSTLRTTQ